ncbi:MAG: hypothetical protein KF819_15640 [Labilithrix sp.]|nr:hypothetical protein [Labilithrix sp.]
MSPRSCSLVLVAAVAVAACRRDDGAGEAGTAKHAKQERVVRELERGESHEAERLLEETAAGAEEAAREAQDAAETIARETRELRDLVARELAWVDRRIADLQRGVVASRGDRRLEKQRDLAAARGFRVRIARDKSILDRPIDDAIWDALKDRVERDLDDDRPPAVPRTYENTSEI